MNDIPPVISPVTARPANWRTALADLLAARLTLVQLELKQAAQSGIKRGLVFGAAAVFLLLMWLGVAAGLIGLISDKGGYPWYDVTLIAAGIHFLVALILLAIAKRPGAATFEITRAEFKKDREWLEKFQSPKKSND